MKRKYHPPEIRTESAFEQETLVCLKVRWGCHRNLPRNPNQFFCRVRMIRLRRCYERTRS